MWINRTLLHSRSYVLSVEPLEDRTVPSAYVVDTIADDPLATATDIDGHVSLREAIMAANTNAAFGDATTPGEGGVDSITFDDVLEGKSIVLGGSELVVSGDLAITGLGMDKLTISGNNSSRIFTIEAGVSVNIKQLKITYGDPSGTNRSGGGIYSEGTLKLTDVELSHNYSGGWGGAIYSDGMLDITGGVISNNESNGSAGGILSWRTLSVTKSTFHNNTAGFHGGAISHRASAGDALMIDLSSFSDNTSGGAGGAVDIWNDSLINVSNSTFFGNSAGSFGGGIDNLFAPLFVENSVFYDNSSGTYGGAIDTWLGSAVLTNSTFSGNSTGHRGGAVSNLGPLTIVNSTIIGNSSSNIFGQESAAGGLFHAEDSRFPNPTMHNTIIGGNTGTNVDGDAFPFDIYGLLHESSSHNLIGDAVTAGGLTHGDKGNIIGNAGLGTMDMSKVLDLILADNGGLTLTHALLTDGPAFNAGNDSAAVDADGNPLLYDQRGPGYARVQGNSVDIGAFEATPPPIQVSIDVRPGSDSNPININSNGVITVALLTTSDFDATQVDVGSVIFAGAQAVHSTFEDVDGDGDLDVVFHFRVEDTVLDEMYAQLMADDMNGDGVLYSNDQSVELSLTGRTLTGDLFEGSDDADLFAAGGALRSMLEELAASGMI